MSDPEPGIEGEPDSAGVPEAGPNVGVVSDGRAPLRPRPLTGERTRRLLPGMRREVADLIAETAFEIERRYWLTRPFAYAVILHNAETGDHEYRVVEPTLDEHEATLYDELRAQLRDQLLYRIEANADADREAVLEEEARSVVRGLAGYQVGEPSFRRVLYYLKRDMLRYERIDPLMRDPQLEEISCNGPDIPVYVVHRRYQDLKTNVAFAAETLQPFVKKLAQRSGKDISTAQPMQGTALPDGSRVQLELSDVAPRGENFTIRKFRELPFTPVDLIEHGTCSIEQMAYLWLLVDEGYSGIIAGGTATGKTTTMNALSMFIPPKRKIVSIEDTREIQIPHENWVATLTREAFSDADEGIGMYDLLRAALRKRPEYLIVGEVRGEEGRDMFQAMNTGHTTYSTLHADSVQTVINRLRNPPISVEVELLSELGFIVIQTDPFVAVDGEKRRVRRATEVVELLGLSDREVDYRPIFQWDERTDEIDRIAESVHFDELRDRGRAPDESFQRRYDVLEYLLDRGITGYDPVSTVIQGFMVAPERVVEQVYADDLDFAELEELGEQAHAG